MQAIALTANSSHPGNPSCASHTTMQAGAAPHTANELHWLTLGLSIVHPVLPCQRLNQVSEGLIPPDVVAVAHAALHLQQ